MITSSQETCPEVLIGTLDYRNRETGVINSHNLLAAVWSYWVYYAHQSEVRLHVDENNFDESHGPRCLCQEPESRSIELNPNTFNRVYAHPKLGEDLFESIAARLESFGGELRLEGAGIRL